MILKSLTDDTAQISERIFTVKDFLESNPYTIPCSTSIHKK
jgi:hypothetical protein